MAKTERLKKNDDFKLVYRKGRSKVNRQFVMYVLKNGTESNRLGISVSKKVGNSVIRHRVKRLIREYVRLHEDMLVPGIDIVVVARNGAGKLSFEETGSSFLHLASLHHILVK